MRVWLPTILLAMAATLAACGSSHQPRRSGQHTITGYGYTIAGNLPAPPARTATTSPASTVSVTPSPPQQVPRPPIVWDPIPFGPRRQAEMAAYAQRHYGLDTYALNNPRVIVIHFTDTPDFQTTFRTFAPDVPDSELHELPGTCSHFVVDQSGVIHQLVPVNIMCRHTVGLNYTAIGVEHVGFTDQQILNDSRQINASLHLVRWLRCTYGIDIAGVIGHNESLSSPYHHENVAALSNQTHNDFNHADMNVYRARLAALGGCA